MGGMHGKKRPIELLTVDEVRALAAAPSRRAPTGVRNRSWILLCSTSGARVDESLALKPKDYDPRKGTIRILRGKGGKARTAPIADHAQEALERWLEVRKGLGITGRSPIFCTLKGGRLSDRYVRAMLERMAARAGIEKKARPHGLRHHFASVLAEKGVPMHHLQILLGHTSLATTQVYLRSISPVKSLEAARDALAEAWAEE